MWIAQCIRVTQCLVAHQAYNNKPHAPHTVEDWLEIGGGVLAVVLVILIVKVISRHLGTEQECPSCDHGKLHQLSSATHEQRDRVLARLRDTCKVRPKPKSVMYCDECGRVWHESFYMVHLVNIFNGRISVGWSTTDRVENRFPCCRCNGLVFQTGWPDAKVMDEYEELLSVDAPRFVCEKCGIEHAWQVDEASAMVIFEPVDEEH